MVTNLIAPEASGSDASVLRSTRTLQPFGDWAASGMNVTSANAATCRWNFIDFFLLTRTETIICDSIAWAKVIQGRCKALAARFHKHHQLSPAVENRDCRALLSL